MTGRIAVLGAGVMGEAMLSSILDAGHPADRMAISERRLERASELLSRYGVTVSSNVEAVADAEVVLVAVKPQDVAGVLMEVADHLRSDAVVVSLAAGVTVSTLENSLPAGTAVVRAMPNTPVVVGAGMFGVSAGGSCTGEQLARIVSLLESGGKVLVVDEPDQDALTAVSGSGPAYLFYLAESMIAGGVRVGLSEEVARELANQTLWGSSMLLASSPELAAELRRRVTSPGGTTAAAIKSFEGAGVAEAISTGIVAARDRSRALAFERLDVIREGTMPHSGGKEGGHHVGI